MNTPLESLDKTEVYSAPPVTVEIKRGRVGKKHNEFRFGFNIGRSEQCDLQIKEPTVSSRHVSVVWENGKWWLKDLGSKNGTYIKSERLSKPIPLPVGVEVSLGVNGPLLVFRVASQEPKSPLPGPGKQTGYSEIAKKYLDNPDPETFGDRTRFFMKTFADERRMHRKKFWSVVGPLSAVLVIALTALGFYVVQLQKLKSLHATAEEMFYSAKSIELQLAQLRAAVEQTGDAHIRRRFVELDLEQRERRKKYEIFLDGLGISRKEMSEEDYLIYKVANVFGECDASMPKAFADTVKKYIGYWKSSGRYERAIRRAQAYDYPARIRDALLEQRMPPQFLYLALQESDFDSTICGPVVKTNVIAKGMWQFIPQTAERYGLQPGALRYERVFDQFDDRHNVDKSSRAAAQYLRDLYNTEAQASGLLVMACYNWGEGNVLPIVRQMPQNPRDRNFWKLLGVSSIPKETYNYVYYIVSAAVIGENPRLFGFDFDNPLQ